MLAIIKLVHQIKSVFLLDTTFITLIVAIEAVRFAVAVVQIQQLIDFNFIEPKVVVIMIRRRSINQIQFVLADAIEV